jgi:hypothetical protein
MYLTAPPCLAMDMHAPLSFHTQTPHLCMLRCALVVDRQESAWRRGNARVRMAPFLDSRTRHGEDGRDQGGQAASRSYGMQHVRSARVNRMHGHTKGGPRTSGGKYFLKCTESGDVVCLESRSTPNGTRQTLFL